jgi:DNA-directed RNA polymerase specialized sigma24 family protein
MRGDEQVQAEFGAAFPGLVTVACHAAQRFFRYDDTIVGSAVAETMAQTYERWERVRRHDNAPSWVLVRTKNVCLELLRAKEETEDAPISARVLETLDHLSQLQRDVAVLRFLMDCDEASTAVALDLTESKVNKIAHKARLRMRGTLDDVYEYTGEAPV